MTNGEMWLKPKGEIWEKVKCDKGEYFSSSKAKLPKPKIVLVFATYVTIKKKIPLFFFLQPKAMNI